MVTAARLGRSLLYALVGQRAVWWRSAAERLIPPLPAGATPPQMPATARAELEARLNDLLTLAGRLPAGAAEDSVRRLVCEVIEAEGANRRITVQALITSIVRLQRERELGSKRAQQHGPAAVDRLLTTLSEVAAACQAGMES